MTTKCDVLIIGGGSTGSSIAYHLARKGITDSIIAERGNQIASGQTSKSTALIRTHYTVPTVAKMAVKSLGFFQNFESELNGRSCGFKLTGLLLCADSTWEKDLSENSKMLEGLGIESRIIDSKVTESIEPCLDVNRFSTIVYEPNSGYADPSLTASAFSNAAVEIGSRILTRTEVLSVKKMASGDYLSETSNGEIEANKVVIANGVWSKNLLGRLGINPIPIKPVRHPVAIFRRPDEYSGTRPLIFDFPRKAYYKPEGKSQLYVGSVEIELDTSRGEVDPDHYEQDVSFEEISRFSSSISECIPVMGSKGSFQTSYTGVYDVTPDQQPVIDELSDEGYEGLFCLIGLSGHGFKLCPEFGRIMADLIVNGNFTDYDISMFNRKRFAEGKLLKSKYGLGTIG
ncbi:MAG TPA: FAD-dependent oxidoreductase [Nitrososphaerales archaeon]|nr:FAD-dependent oxidoreductase [Nitrososphaerales archaeon]